MSWKDKLENQMIITCGDGTQYFPLWTAPTKKLEWNVAEFNFPKIKGTLVKKSKMIGRKFPLEFYFQGEDHLDTAAEFEVSANDERPWKIEHPFYGIITVQVPALDVDNTGLNVSKYTGIAIETIVEDNPKVSVDPVDSILIKKAELDVLFENALTGEIQPVDVTESLKWINRTIRIVLPKIKIPEQVTAMLDLFRKANALVNKMTSGPLAAMRGIIALVSYPAKLKQNVKSRINALVEQFDTLTDTIDSITHLSSKQLYQNNAGCVLSTIALAAATPEPNDYKSSTDALEVMELLLATYNTYLENIDALQSENGSTPESYIPDGASLIALSSMIGLTVSNLYNIALSARKERSIITETDTNWIVLTHRFYGLDPSDANIDELIANNNGGLNKMLQIKKGTKIVYYV